MNLNNKEIESVSDLEPFERYKYLIKRIADWGMLLRRVFQRFRNRTGELLKNKDDYT